jgi:hypothetical protein
VTEDRTAAAPRLDVMNRLGRAMADPTRSRILLSLIDEPGYPAHLARAIGALVDVVLAVDDGVPCTDEDCDVPLCCGPGEMA